MTYGEPSYLDMCIIDRLHLGVCAFGPLTHEEYTRVEAYEQWAAEAAAEHERVCGVSISTGGFDPYGTSCHLDKGHDGPHEGPDLFGVGSIRWDGRRLVRR